jgi:hypothetical protein
MRLPEYFADYFAGGGPKEGALSVAPGWFQLWHPAEVEQMNRNYHVPQAAPGFLAFGTSGGGELLAFDTNGCVVMIPFIPLSPEHALLVANSWSEFIENIE